MPIVKTTYTYVVLHEETDMFDSLEQAISEAYDGNAVGLVVNETTTKVANKDVPLELEKLDNDGTFFNLDD